MTTVSALRILWRLRVLTAACAVLAVLAGLSMAYELPSMESRGYEVGVGSAQALVDTPSSQIVDLGGEEATADITSLSARASLLASLMTSSPMKEKIASRARIQPDQLIAVPPASAMPGAGNAPSPDTTARMKAADAKILKTTIPELQSGQIPIIHVQTQAPDPATAGRLADSAIEVLEDELANIAASGDVPGARRITIRALGPATQTVEGRGSGKIVAVFAAVFLFGLGCALLLGLTAFIQAWRRASVQESYGPAEVYDIDFVGNGNGDRGAVPNAEPAGRARDAANL
jgi:hypothetical protein